MTTIACSYGRTRHPPRATAAGQSAHVLHLSVELDGKPFAVESKFSFKDRMSSSD